MKLKFYVVIVIAGLFLFTILIDKILSPISTIYNITAKTEKAKCFIVDIGGSSFNIYRSTIFDENDSIIVENFSGNFRFLNSAWVEFERISLGSVLISFQNDTLQPIGAFYKDEELVFKTKDKFQIIIDSIEVTKNEGFSLIFPITGIFEIGGDVAGQVEGITTPILREGTVTMAASSKLSKSYYKAGIENLYMGDKLIFEDQKENAIAFVSIDNQDALNIAFRVEATKAVKLKPGPRDINSEFKNLCDTL
ncbi:MAG: hypothetical protein IPO92_18775 [Saprospiraceae bacterium]|nr:hypothetical protein [Saprospiraceae bacterium]